MRKLFYLVSAFAALSLAFTACVNEENERNNDPMEKYRDGHPLPPVDTAEKKHLSGTNDSEGGQEVAPSSKQRPPKEIDDNSEIYKPKKIEDI